MENFILVLRDFLTFVLIINLEYINDIIFSLNTFKFIKIRNKASKELHYEYRFCFEESEKYLKASDISSYEREEALQDILDMLLEAQSLKTPIGNIFGDNDENFLKNIVEEYKKPKNILYKTLLPIQQFITTTLFIIAIMIIIMSIYGKSIIYGFNNAISYESLVLLFIYFFIMKRYRTKYDMKKPFHTQTELKKQMTKDWFIVMFFTLIMAWLFYYIFETILHISVLSSLPLYEYKLYLLFLIIASIFIEIYIKKYSKSSNF